ncbi:peptidoglycan recognition protein 6 isoform X2 [Etheostoma spectabile]|uniref:peptidoglycan recognition protein 6 isoform X1 n=1 Tax=Etheostoma spectabile TaxID=54343 RepID=UPI0013AEDEFC|nr:N-acetylmuramoyl-L-alanine amidase-like isoform X1 [Etheostoma spectabile]XP_032394033.1 N-acetylmuramoyl-L-alanine amidase-like isoform X2 [Etheostoma spectabile]
METDGWKRTAALVVVVVLVGTCAEALFSRHMDDFIEAVKQVEYGSPGSDPVAVVRTLRRAAGLDDAFIRHFLGDADSAHLEMKVNANLFAYIREVVPHRVSEGSQEEGVVLTPDGTTVALAPLLLGIEAGFLPKSAGRLRTLYQLTLGKDLERSAGAQQLGPDGCWDNVTSPRVFTLLDRPSLLTTARVNGAVDGVLLGKEVSTKPRRPMKISGLLAEYYSRPLGSEGLDAAPPVVSRRRRENFKRLLVDPQVLERQLVKSVELQRRLRGRPKMDVKKKKQLTALVKERMEEFVHEYLDCPPIIPRCMWGAEPYRGTPTNLSLPLSFMYVHHTHTPSQPCLTFQQCSADMRSMQRFHQDDRGWDDIGYSFVAGSDGSVYEGRGWVWRGAHTLGHNSIGYGVSFIGDYASTLPSQHAMGLVRDRLASCAVGGGRLVANFTLQGHRQVVDTSCPGDALYNEIRGWGHYGEAKK